MSLLIFDQYDDAVIVITDTLVSTPDRQPVDIAHKVWSFPQHRMVVAMTGTRTVGDLWSARILELFPEPTDIETINTVAQAELTTIHDAVTDVYGDHGTSTIYMFAFRAGTSELVRYVYRSKLGYSPEPGEGYAFGYKPRPESFTVSLPETQEQIIDLAIRIRHENDHDLCEKPVAIGGDLVATRLSTDGIETQHWYRFPGHEVTLGGSGADALSGPHQGKAMS